MTRPILGLCQVEIGFNLFVVYVGRSSEYVACQIITETKTLKLNGSTAIIYILNTKYDVVVLKMS